MVDLKPAKPSLAGLYARNYFANISGNLIIVLLNIFTPVGIFQDWRAFLLQSRGWVLLIILLPTVFILAGVLQYLVQRPIATLISQSCSGEKIVADLQQRARRRLLNLPLILGVINLILWVSVTPVFITVLSFIAKIGWVTSLYILFRGVIIGLVAAFISFFLIDDYSRKRLVPWLFPGGRLAGVSGTVKISILRRIRVLYGVGTNAPLLILVGTLALLLWQIDDAAISAADFAKDIFIFIIVLYIIFVAIAFSLNFLVAKSILTPIKDMMGIVYNVRHGEFDHNVRVVTNDELGVLGDGMNEMTAGLIERDRMRRSLYLAKEVQQTLLPRTDPHLKGLDIASTIVYCDETGGDYYDFLGGDEPNSGKISVVVGDVSGHGVSSALLMATTRAFLRQRSALPGSVSRIVSDVNRQLARDVEESSGFMTLFYLTIDTDNRKLNWVRAGHDPAIFYDPATDTFQELRGVGMALGVKADTRFEENRKNNLEKNQIILLGTDGIWEARNLQGEMFGKEPIYRTIRQNHALSAKEILAGIFNTLNRFLEDRALEDDVTLVVIKVTGD